MSGNKKIKIIISERKDLLPCGHSLEEQCGCEKEEPPNAHQGEEGRMHRTSLAMMISDATALLDMVDDETDLPEWAESKITKASDYIQSVARYIAGNLARDKGLL